jgi:hypothetical protein
LREGVGRELAPVAAPEYARARRRGRSEGNESRVNNLEGYARSQENQKQLIHFGSQKPV